MELYWTIVKEENLLDGTTSNSEYFQYRRYVVDYVMEVGERLRLESVIIHGAASYLDRLLIDEKRPSRKQIEVIVMVCLWLSAKYNGSEVNLPSMAMMAEVIPHFPIELLVKMETIVLTRLEWKLHTNTTMHILGILYGAGVLLHAEDLVLGQETQEAFPSGYYWRYLNFFADLCLQDDAFNSFTPSMVSASIIAVSREALQIRPLWRKELTNHTGYSFDKIENCFDYLWQRYSVLYPHKRSSSPDSVSHLVHYNTPC